MVDEARVAALLYRIRSELGHLRRSARLGEEELGAEGDALPAAKYRLIVCVEAATDVADHLIASEGFRPSTSFADSFRVLHETGVIAPRLSEAMQDAARFRNLLVHQYADVDDARVVRIIRSRLEDLDQFVESVAAFLNAGK